MGWDVGTCWGPEHHPKGGDVGAHWGPADAQGIHTPLPAHGHPGPVWVHPNRGPCYSEHSAWLEQRLPSSCEAQLAAGGGGSPWKVHTQTQQKTSRAATNLPCKKTTLYTADSTPEQHRAKCNQESLELRATGDRFYLQHRGCPRLTTA